MFRVALLRIDLSTVDDLLDLLDQNRPLLIIRNVEGTLDDVVCELVVNHFGETIL